MNPDKPLAADVPPVDPTFVEVTEDQYWSSLPPRQRAIMNMTPGQSRKDAAIALAASGEPVDMIILGDAHSAVEIMRTRMNDGYFSPDPRIVWSLNSADFPIHPSLIVQENPLGYAKVNIGGTRGVGSVIWPNTYPADDFRNPVGGIYLDGDKVVRKRTLIGDAILALSAPAPINPDTTVTPYNAWVVEHDRSVDLAAARIAARAKAKAELEAQDAADQAIIDGAAAHKKLAADQAAADAANAKVVADKEAVVKATGTATGTTVAKPPVKS